MITLSITIIEDKPEELDHLKSLLEKTQKAAFHIVEELHTLQDAINSFKNQPAIDLVFMDIQLPDGLSFEIFKHLDLPTPVIFTSSYDHYVLQAIKANGVDYLIKPINMADLDAAIENFLRRRSTSRTYELEEIKSIVNTFIPKAYKSSFLVNFRHKMLLIDVREVAYCYVKEKGTFLVTRTGKEYLVDYYLDQLEEELDPNTFYRVNRQYLMAKSAIREIETHFNGRLLLSVNPPVAEKITLSKKKVSHFKRWADS